MSRRSAKPRRDAVLDKAHYRAKEIEMKLLCKCGWEGDEEDLDLVCVFQQTQEEPAEYAGRCPSCRGPEDSMDEVELCESCGEEEPMNKDTDLCGGCAADKAEYDMEDR
jgi:Zn finger protein HypA/HybF involved in hydrogenase expression